jgi:hypothetical protein
MMMMKMMDIMTTTMIQCPEQTRDENDYDEQWPFTSVDHLHGDKNEADDGESDDNDDNHLHNDDDGCFLLLENTSCYYYYSYGNNGDDDATFHCSHFRHHHSIKRSR